MSSMQLEAAAKAIASPRLSRAFSRVARSERSVQTPRRMKTVATNPSVAPISLTPRRAPGGRGVWKSVATGRRLEFLGGLHALAHGLVLGVGARREARDLERLQRRRVLELEQ